MTNSRFLFTGFAAIYKIYFLLSTWIRKFADLCILYVLWNKLCFEGTCGLSNFIRFGGILHPNPRYTADFSYSDNKTQMSHRHYTVYPKKYAHGFCFAVLCCGYTLTDFPISIRLTSLALWQSNDCPSASKATLMNMDKYFMWIHYERLRNHNKVKHNKTVCIFLGIYCTRSHLQSQRWLT